MRRVVVTGLGVVAPNGVGTEAFWNSCVDGRSGVGPVRSFDASQHPVKIAAEVPPFDFTAFVPVEQKKCVKIMSRAMHFGLAAAGMAVHDSGIDLAHEDPEQVAVVMGTGLIPLELPEVAPLITSACDENGRMQPTLLGAHGDGAIFPLWLLKHLPNMVAAHISLAFNTQRSEERRVG